MFYQILSAILMTAPLAAASQEPTTTTEQNHSMISAEKLKSWYNKSKPMVVLDARSEKYFDGTLLPNAMWLPSESTEEEILTAVPNINSLVVVYCHGIDCPASGWLYDKLYSMGYQNIYEYHEGIEDWIQRGYPTTQQK